MIISFHWTAPALLAGAKTVTRRMWTPSHARLFHQGDLVAAYDRSPRYGGKRIASIRITKDPYLELARHAPESDWEAEGFAYMHTNEPRWAKHAEAIWTDWKTSDVELWVVRFQLVEVAS